MIGNLPALAPAFGTLRLNVTRTLPSAFVVLPVNGAVFENENPQRARVNRQALVRVRVSGVGQDRDEHVDRPVDAAALDRGLLERALREDDLRAERDLGRSRERVGPARPEDRVEADLAARPARFLFVGPIDRLVVIDVVVSRRSRSNPPEEADGAGARAALVGVERHAVGLVELSDREVHRDGDPLPLVDRRHEEVQDRQVRADQLGLGRVRLAVVVQVLDDVGDDRDLRVGEVLHVSG